MSETKLGKCCKCGEGYCNQPVLYPLGRDRLIYVDRCIAPELHSLWNKGIKTEGCCCGHAEKDGFIQVTADSAESMLELGYEAIPPVEIDGCLMGVNCFKPKTQFEHNGYMGAKTELQENYEKLEKVATNALHLLEILEDDLGAEVTFTRDETHEKWSAKVFRDQLKELGVEV